MSEANSPLKELGRFSAGSPALSAEPSRSNDALWALARAFSPPRPMHQRVGDMVAVVKALSSRTRRISQPRMTVEIDVFAPNGERALRIFLPET